MTHAEQPTTNSPHPPHDLEPGERLDPHLRDLRHESAERPLDREDLVDDPFAQFARWYAEATEHESVPYPNAVQLATASADGEPSVRTVLVRDADVATGFVFFTNYESRKGRDLAENPRAAIIFVWQGMERQIIARGRVEKISDEESDDYFHRRPYGSRIGAIASEQSRPVGSKEELEHRAAELSKKHPEEEGVPRPGFWGGFRLIAEEIEFWQGRASRLHDRFLYAAQSDREHWVITRLQP